ncbi:ADP-ribosylarginine hydrolase Tri1 [Erwinia amylovora]|uniref:ADP-ribosylglycohydrolase family protein n=4 Tax=Erwinia amylovora TaxID=552 RepID=A0ABX7MFM5_ERWAM|nr:ADP-ribosylarginine hydrolase Tri1 [Erwinia amylovora]CBX81879.1 putative ADP-ribosyl-[dinitrogen reductase] hydrolase [Erwinia amylovora ATCC BAA-2158]CDK16350.1 putative ADP-ribosyl-[dinitrogen reductase] hydrolase [Erwinia amylovora LA635]CDK19716.1 putative ADP-ribosyl-[dinitrogen reductase] hydrolase [Erwinia amylovora LA636]CDK23088.1 putative ADP-ribosyl-[dinitrogen reductase] hydrolase [Erwinia amylovora LA637]ATZ10528.1 ADP-ribosylglycohydrolase family protein [Erwinia amylovora]
MPIDLRQPYPLLNGYVFNHYRQYCPSEYQQDLAQGRDVHVDYARWLNEQSPLPQWLRHPQQQGSEQQRLDRAKGALVGLAVADAVGTTLEFQPRDQQFVSDMVGGGPFQLKAGEWTDDTSMALCLAETYLHHARLDLTGFRNRLVNWYRHGVNSANGICFDIGNATRHALEQYLLQGADWFGNTDPHSAGNAAIIRLAPAAIFQRHSLLRTLHDAEQQGRATHGATESLDASRLLARVLCLLLNGADKHTAMAPALCPFNARTALINAGEYRQKSRAQIRSSGYVIDTLEAAMWAIWHTDNFRDAVLLAANLADDADSVAATAGQIAGALYGYDAIPAGWREKLVEEPRIAQLAQRLYETAPVA